MRRQKVPGFLRIQVVRWVNHSAGEESWECYWGTCGYRHSASLCQRAFYSHYLEYSGVGRRAVPRRGKTFNAVNFSFFQEMLVWLWLNMQVVLIHRHEERNALPLDRGSLLAIDLISTLLLHFPAYLVCRCASEAKFWPRNVNRKLWNFWNIFLGGRVCASLTFCLCYRQICCQYELYSAAVSTMG